MGNSAPFGCLPNNRCCQSPGLALSFMTIRPYVMLGFSLTRRLSSTLREIRGEFLNGLRVCCVQICTPINGFPTKSGVSELWPSAHGNLLVTSFKVVVLKLIRKSMILRPQRRSDSHDRKNNATSIEMPRGDRN